MLLVARANSARLYDMRTGRVLRYFYPLHSGHDTCLVRSIAFGSRDDIVMIAWSDNYIETYERSRLVGLEVTPLARTLPPTATQEFRVEALYDDGSRLNVTPRAYRSGESAPGGAQVSADPSGMVDLAEGRVTLSAQATGTIVLTAAYSEGGVTRSATARITVGPCPLVSLTPNVPEITLTHGVVMPVYFTATYADGYQETVTPVLSVDAPEHVKIAGNNLTVLRSTGTRHLTITGTFTSRGVTRSAVMQVITHGPQSNWVRSQITSGGDVMAMDYRPDGHQLAVGGSSGAIALYAVGLSPTAYELEAVVPAHERAIRRLFYVHTDELVSVGEDGWIRTWSLADTRQPVREYSHDAAITCAAYFDGWLAFGDNLGRVHALLPGQNRLVWSRTIHNRPVRGIAVDEDAVFSGGDDRRAVLSRRSDGSQVRVYPGYSESIMAVGMRHGMTYTVSDDRRMVEWTKGTVDENLWEFFLPGLPSAIHQTQDRLYVTVGSEKTTMEDDQAVITGYRSTTWVYDDGGLLLHQMEHPPQEGRVTALAASPDGEWLLTGRSTIVLPAKDAGTGEVEWRHFPFHSVQFWSATRSSYRGSLDHNRSIESARVTRDGSWLYTLSPERVFRWHLGAELERSKFLETGYDIPYRFEGLSLSDDPTGTVVTRVGETLYLLDGAERRLRMSVHHPGASTFDLSPDSRRLVSDGDNLRLWDISVDFPTVIHEVLEKRAQCLAFFPSCLPDRQGDWIAGLNDLDFGSDQGGPWEPFLAVMNDRGLQFSGLPLPLPEDADGEILGARMKPVVAVARNQSRCVVVAQPVSRDELGGWVALDKAYLYIIDLCTTDEGVSPRLLRRIECDAREARVAVALSDDGSLLFYGGAPTDDQGAAPGQLLDISTGRLLFTFAPPSMGTMANRGPAAAQFTRNDAALMIAWGEGYSSIHLRQGLDRLELTPVVKTVSPGEAVPLRATAIYVDGSRMDVTAEAQWSLQTTPHATLNGPKLVVGGSAPTGAALQVKAVYDGMGATREALSRFTVDVPKFLELTADPVRRSLAPGSEVIVRYFARMADGSTRDVSTLTTLTADPIDRVLMETNRVRVPAFAQAGYVQIEGRCVLDGDERTVVSVLRIRDALELGNPGDFDGDGQVAFPDVLHLVAHYGLQPSSDRWDARCDFNGNLVIDFPDVLALVALYGKTYDTPRLHGDPAVTDGEVLAHLRLEGPMGPVVVGQPFEVRIYARESTTDAIGITGVLLDMQFDADHIGVVLPFDPAVAIASPYRSILVHGTAGGPGIDELGGVCLEGGYGDGAEVLFATLQFTARVAGETALRLAPGESGLALTQPAGLLSTDRVDYGPPWVVRIVEGTVPPAANEFLGRLEVTRPSLRQTLRYATKAGASVGFVPQEGDASGLPPGEAGEGAWLSLGDQLLGTDVRPTTLGQVWQVRFVVPPGALADQAWNLSWLPTDVPEGTGLLLLPADRDGHPAPGPRRSLRQQGALRMENAGEEPISVNFLIAWDRSTTQTWRLEPGWNLVGCSLEPDETTTAALLEHPGLRAMLQWTPSRGYSIPEALDSRLGYLVYVDAPLEFLLTGVPVLAGVCRLEPGWNLVSTMLSDGTGSAPAMESQSGRARWVLIPGEQSVLWQVPGLR
jgi:WD40 repeat protein